MKIIIVSIFIIMLSISAAFAGNYDEEHGHEHDAHSRLISVENEMEVPTVKIRAKKDPLGGWNIHIMTVNFRFTPENVNKKHIPGQGHAHIYVDGKKVARVYGHWFHLAKQSPGIHEVRVSLNANSHEVYSFDGKKIEGITSITE